MADPKGYESIFSGEEIDKAVEMVLSGNIRSGHRVIPTSPNNKADLNEIIEPAVYSIDYYENGYDDTCVFRPIHLHVSTVNSEYLIQRYTFDNTEVYRYYKYEDGTFTEWKVRDNVRFVSSSDVVSVDMPTLIIREGDKEVNTAEGMIYE